MNIPSSVTVSIYLEHGFQFRRHEEMDDVLIIQPPQIHSHPRKDKHRRHHKDGKKKTKGDTYSDDEKSASRKSDRPTGNVFKK